jgi:hypothetical protein
MIIIMYNTDIQSSELKGEKLRVLKTTQNSQAEESLNQNCSKVAMI